VVVYDCVSVGANGLADAIATEPADTNADAGAHRLDAAEVIASDGEWKVEAWAPLEEGLEECTSSER
jgi:hypothetical protein